MYATFDRSTFPLVTVTFTGVKETPENFQVYLDGLLANYDRKESFGLVFDASKSLSLRPDYQLKQARWMKEHFDLIERYCVGVAYVIPNPILRQVLQLIFNLQKSPTEFKVFAEIQEAQSWLQPRIDLRT